MKQLRDAKTDAKYSIDKKFDIVKTVKTTSNKIEELKRMRFEFTI